jgi:DNA repair photolyase
MNRLDAGWIRWRNPYSQDDQYVSFVRTRIIVFWSKDPAPFFIHLPSIASKGFGIAFQYTLNNYEPERLEPNLPSCRERIRSFIRLSEMIGHGRITWRFDPLLLSETITVQVLLERIEEIGNQIHEFTGRLVVSFIDIARYRKVSRNLLSLGFPGVREFSPCEMEEFAEGLHNLNRDWGLEISACGERADLERYGITKGSCISYSMLIREFGSDPMISAFLGRGTSQTSLIMTPAGSGSTTSSTPRHLRDPGQRNQCGCVVSKDIGQYSTCPHLCAYCYANSSPVEVRRNYECYQIRAQRGHFTDMIADPDYAFRQETIDPNE